ncbi:hypothetical protein D3C81_1134240 [compost metagenome]
MTGGWINRTFALSPPSPAGNGTLSGNVTAASPRATCAPSISSCATFSPTSAADEAAGASTPSCSSLSSDTATPAPAAPSVVGGLPSMVVSNTSRFAAPSTSA